MQRKLDQCSSVENQPQARGRSMSGPPSKTKAGAGGGIRAFVSALQNLANPKEAQGQVVDVPGYYWQGGSEAGSVRGAKSSHVWSCCESSRCPARAHPRPGPPSCCHVAEAAGPDANLALCSSEVAHADSRTEDLVTTSPSSTGTRGASRTRPGIHIRMLNPPDDR